MRVVLSSGYKLRWWVSILTMLSCIIIIWTERPSLLVIGFPSSWTFLPHRATWVLYTRVPQPTPQEWRLVSWSLLIPRQKKLLKEDFFKFNLNYLRGFLKISFKWVLWSSAKLNKKPISIHFPDLTNVKVQGLHLLSKFFFRKKTSSHWVRMVFPFFVDRYVEINFAYNILQMRREPLVHVL